MPSSPCCNRVSQRQSPLGLAEITSPTSEPPAWPALVPGRLRCHSHISHSAGQGRPLGRHQTGFGVVRRGACRKHHQADARHQQLRVWVMRSFLDALISRFHRSRCSTTDDFLAANLAGPSKAVVACSRRAVRVCRPAVLIDALSRGCRHELSDNGRSSAYVPVRRPPGYARRRARWSPASRRTARLGDHAPFGASHVLRPHRQG